jgi:hypothetical protein
MDRPDFKKGKFVVEYLPPKSRDEEKFPTTIQELCRIPIPEEDHNRSRYLHHAMTAIENAAHYADWDEVSVRSLLGMLNDYVSKKRHLMNPDHRVLSWTCRCRLRWLLCYERADKTTSDRDYLIKMKLATSDVPDSVMGVTELWRALQVVLVNYNSLRYRVQLEKYVSNLNDRIAYFSFVESSDRKVMNNVLFVDEVRERPGTYAVNDGFLKETERICYHVKAGFDRYRALMVREEVTVEGYGEKKKVLHDWLLSECHGLYREFVEKEFRKDVYSVFVNPTEDERYREEETFGDPKPYSIVARYRPNQIDEINAILDKNDYVTEVVREHEKSFKRDSHRTDVLYDYLFTIVLKYYLESSSGLVKDSKPYIIHQSSPFTPDQILSLSDSFPRIVQVFNQYGIVYKRMTAVCADAGEVFLSWLSLICEDEEIGGSFPDTPDKDVIDLYLRFFPENSRKVNKPIVEDPLQLEMPDFYE